MSKVLERQHIHSKTQSDPSDSLNPVGSPQLLSRARKPPLFTHPCRGTIEAVSSPRVSKNYFPFHFRFLCSHIFFLHILSFLSLIILATNKSGFPILNQTIPGFSGAIGIWYWQILACSLRGCADQAKPAASTLLAFLTTSVQRFEGRTAGPFSLILVSGHL